jgi:hypothetical protein
MMKALPRSTHYILLTVLVTACTGTPTPVPTPSAEQVDAEEQAVYAALFGNFYGAPRYVIMESSATGPSGVEDTEPNLSRVLQDMRGVNQGTVDSFRQRNAESHPFEPNMELGSPYVLLSQAEMNLIFSPNRDGWQSFYNQYPDAPGITTLSRVGFNSTLDQALVYVGTMSHYLAGAGYYVLLVKESGVWKVDQQMMTWIS